MATTVTELHNRIHALMPQARSDLRRWWPASRSPTHGSTPHRSLCGRPSW
jgi:hypothetical protein